MNSYEEKQAARKARLENAADRAQERSNAAYDASKSAIDGIPYGQPILVGHHSEGRHRRDLARSHDKMRRSIEEAKHAENLQRKADAVGSGGISSDDPDAVKKLTIKLDALVKKQNLMKRINKLFRSGDVQILIDEGLMKPDQINAFEGAKHVFASYELTNNNAAIRATKGRIEALLKSQEKETVEHQFEGFRVVENVEENRVQIIFPGKPSAEVRAVLKSEAFRWSPRAEAWQRKLTNAGRYAAKCVIRDLTTVPPSAGEDGPREDQ